MHDFGDRRGSAQRDLRCARQLDASSDPGPPRRGRGERQRARRAVRPHASRRSRSTSRCLERAGLIVRGQRAQYRPCTLDAAPLEEISTWAEQYRPIWEARFDRMDDYLSQTQLSTTRSTNRPTRSTRTTKGRTNTMTDDNRPENAVVIERTFDAPSGSHLADVDRLRALQGVVRPRGCQRSPSPRWTCASAATVSSAWRCRHRTARCRCGSRASISRVDRDRSSRLHRVDVRRARQREVTRRHGHARGASDHDRDHRRTRSRRRPAPRWS